MAGVSSGDSPRIPFHLPSVDAADEAAVLEVLRSGWLTSAGRAAELERRCAELSGVAHGVATNSCTAALHLALVALGVGPGADAGAGGCAGGGADADAADEVVLSPITFASAANVVLHCGATPVFCDVQPDTLNMDPDALAAALTERTRAVIAVHFAGHPAEMDRIRAVCDPLDVPVIEDAAHAIGARHKGRPVGSLGRVAAYSFYATKNITSGEGGMLVTDDAALAERAKLLSLHGMTRDAWKRYSDAGYRHWDIVAPGFKYNLSDMQAALALSQLDKLAAFNAERRRLVELYDRLLADVSNLEPLLRRADVESAYHLYVVRVRAGAPLDRDGLMAALTAAGIGVGVHFRPVHLHPYYREALGFRPGMCPVAEATGERVLSLPLFPGMRDADVERVAEACRTALA